jgi:formylglycine-generating enzyme required for sulfatase activity
MLANQEFVARFTREIEALVKLSHPHIVKILDVGEQDGIPIFVMDYLPGGSLRDRRPRGPDGNFLPAPPAQLSHWLGHVAEALDVIHTKGYIHRDVKPDNILFDADNNAYLGDFGITRVHSVSTGIVPSPSQSALRTSTGMLIGTPHYTAPEIVQEQPFGPPADQYSLAVTVWEMLSGRIPFDGPFPAVILVMQTNTDLPLLSELVPAVPPALAQAVRKGLAKDPLQRFPSCKEFAQAVLAPLSLRSSLHSWSTSEILSTCPACQKPIRLPASASGKSLACPRCGAIFVAAVLSAAGPAPAVPKPAPPAPAPRPHDDQSLTATVPSLGSAPSLTPVMLPPPQASATPALPAALPLSQVSPLPRSPRRRLLVGLTALAVLALVGVSAGLWLLRGDGDGGKKTDSQEPPGVVLDKQITNSLGMKLVLIPAGEYERGSSVEDKIAAGQERPQHQVKITRSFYLGAYEVTVKEFAEFVKAAKYKTDAEILENGEGYEPGARALKQRPFFNWNNPGFDQTELHPVVNVSWKDAVEFCRWLSQKEKKIYRLPTEAEWEYACRAGTKTRLYNGDSHQLLKLIANVADRDLSAKINPKQHAWEAWNDGHAFTAPVGNFQANDWGLHDMLGNVFEWCQDWYDPEVYQRGLMVDPTGAPNGIQRVVRGGSWFQLLEACRCAYRDGCDPLAVRADLGFRVVCEVEDKGKR